MRGLPVALPLTAMSGRGKPGYVQNSKSCPRNSVSSTSTCLTRWISLWANTPPRSVFEFGGRGGIVTKVSDLFSRRFWGVFPQRSQKYVAPFSPRFVIETPLNRLPGFSGLPIELTLVADPESAGPQSSSMRPSDLTLFAPKRESSAHRPASPCELIPHDHQSWTSGTQRVYLQFLRSLD